MLPNGLHYYVRKNGKPEHRAELRLVVNAGSILEDDDQQGLAHFVEHMAFNGTTHFAKNEIIDYLRSIGMRFGGDLNASTSYDETSYRLTVPTDSADMLATGLDILQDWAHGMTLDSAEVAAERGVVLEEWRRRLGASARVLARHDSIIYKGSRYADRLPIGQAETIKHASPPELRRFYHDWYRPDLMAVVVVGDIDPAAIEARIRERFGAIPAAEHPRKRISERLVANAEPLVSIVTDPEVTGSSVQVLYKLPMRSNQGTRAAYRESLVNGLFNRMLNQRLSELAQRSNQPFLGASASSGTLVRLAPVHSFTASVPKDGLDRGLDALLTEVERVAQHGFTPAELERAKTSTLRGAESNVAARDAITSAAYAQSYVANFLVDRPIESVEQGLDLMRDILPGIQLAEVDSVANVWHNANNRLVLATLPEKEGWSVPTRDELLAIFDSVRARKLAPYSETLSEAPLVAKLPTPGAVTEEHQVPEVGVTEWTLANGVHVLLKPTDFNADQILVRGFSPGGTSLASDSLFLNAQYATQLLSVGGLGPFDHTELQKRLAGTIVSVGVSMAQNTEGLNAGGSPRNLETLFQLIYLQAVAPRIDTAAVAAYKTSLRTSLANRAASPAALFRDTVVAVMTQHHPRTRTITTAMVDSLDAEKALAFFRDRFADASDFTFVIVGAFDPDTIRPLVERYLGGLPSIKRKEKARDVGIRPPTGIVRRTVAAGTEPKSETVLYFTGKAPITPETQYILDGANVVLQRRLTERLREQLGGTYSASVRASLSRYPDDHYEVAISFGSAPERIDELTAAVLAEITDLQKVGPTPQEVHDVAAQQERSRETALRQNSYWLGTLASYAMSGWDISGLDAVEPPGGGKALTAQVIQRAAREYFNLENYVVISRVPVTSAE